MNRRLRKTSYNSSIANTDTFITSYLTLIIILVGVFVYLTSGAEINLRDQKMSSPTISQKEPIDNALIEVKILLPKLFSPENTINQQNNNLLKLISRYARARNLSVIGEINYFAKKSSDSLEDPAIIAQTAALWQYFQSQGINRNQSFFALTPARNALSANTLIIKLYQGFPANIYPL